MYTDYCGVLHTPVHEMVLYICGAIHTNMVHLSYVIVAKKTMQSLLKDVAQWCKK